ncbi:MAG: hypothetical protein FGM18_05065 [Burkholderiaceae bacterium]|nr:hypothetical protein [Burkholderiaceae bacterium]
MNTLTRPYRWFGLEVGGHRYAIDFYSVATVFYQPADGREAARVQAGQGPFLNIRGLLVHEGAPVFLLPPSRLFTSVRGPLESNEHDRYPDADAKAPPWVVVFNGDSLSSVGIRVDHASGPFRLTPELPEAEAFNKKEIAHLDHFWTVVRLRANAMEGMDGDAHE